MAYLVSSWQWSWRSFQTEILASCWSSGLTERLSSSWRRSSWSRSGIWLLSRSECSWNITGNSFWLWERQSIPEIWHQLAILFMLHFSQSAHLILIFTPDGVARIFFLPPYAAAGVRTHARLVELHHDPGPFEGCSTDWATAPRQDCNSWQCQGCY